jgi:hypothetical protein
MTEAILDPITATPCFAGPSGRAWRCRPPLYREEPGFNEGEDAHAAGWVIEAPQAHPFWHSYLMTLIHLRPLPVNRPTIFYLEGATHEIWLHALTPDGSRQKLVDGHSPGGEASNLLVPLNFAAQLIELSDESAVKRCEAAIQRVCDGTLSPDTDHIRTWMHLFGDNMIKDRKRAGETLLVTPGGVVRIPARPGPQDLN